MQKIVLASNNQHKISELGALLADAKFEVLSQAEFKIQEAEETGLTFIENAILKARNVCRYSNLPSLADDSGLAVDALNGLPGVHSARFAGVKSTNKENVAKLLSELQNVPEEKRSARFHCVLVYLRHALDPAPICCHGIWEGSILFAPRGKNGFGYDPIFFVPTHNCSAAELSPQVKNSLSHRGQALQQFLHVIGEM